MNTQVINHYLTRHESFLERTLDQYMIPAELIRRAMHYSLFPGGKRIRPLLVYLMGELVHVEVPVLDVIAAAIEFTHGYSLIHDDLPAMDNDDFRRGKPSCHKAFDEATAILAGDGLQALAIDLLLSQLEPLLTSAKTIAITRELLKASGASGMVSGQSLDISELSKPCITEEFVQQIHHLKTGQLISACVEMVLAANNQIKNEEKKALRTYASHMGLVFQMQDDFLDGYASTQRLGKNRASDVVNNKTTFATLYAKNELEEQISQHYQMAMHSLALFDNKASLLLELTQTLKNRSHLETEKQ